MTIDFSTKLGMERCLSCGHRWIDYEKARSQCFLCNGTSLSECVSLKEIREAITGLRKEDKNYLDKHAKRTVILKQLYREIAELSLARAQEIYSKVKDHYSKGELTDKVLEQLVMAFRLFSDLGVHKSAAACAYMAAMGYAQRGKEKEIRNIDDLNDLVSARQWFLRLGSKEWEAAVNLHIGEKSMSTISTDSSLLQMMMQVSLWHFYKARDYFFEQRNTPMMERIQFDIQRSAQLLESYSASNSQIEAARIAAQSTLAHGEFVKKGLEALGTSVQRGLTALGEHIESSTGNLTQGMMSASRSISSTMTQTMLAMGSTKMRGRSLDRRMSEVGQLLSTTARELPEHHIKPVKELGTKFALGAVGAATTDDITQDPSVRQLADSVEPDAQRSQTTLKQIEEPNIRLTGTLLDTLISKGLDKVSEQLQQQSDNQEPDRD